MDEVYSVEMDINQVERADSSTVIVSLYALVDGDEVTFTCPIPMEQAKRLHVGQKVNLLLQAIPES